MKRHCVVIGGTGGLGSAFAQLLEKRGDKVWRLARSYGDDDLDFSNRRLRCDYHAAETLSAAADIIKEHGPLDLVIVATGLLHQLGAISPEKSLRDLDPDVLAEIFQSNAIGPGLAMKHFLPLMQRQEKTIFASLSARVGSISDNRLGGWYGYRAAKAALNQLIKTASIEHARRWPNGIVVGLHPGTVASDLSKPFQRNVAADRLFTADYSAQRLLDVLENLTPTDSGKVFSYDGSEIPS